jgi:alpha-ketoglutarate-dependent taurine dioxygenase
MSSAAFGRIVNKYPAFSKGIANLERYLSVRSIEIAVRPDGAADFVGLKPDFVKVLLDNLVTETVLEKRLCWICKTCDTPIETEEDDGKRECDLCNGQYSEAEVLLEECYFLKRTIVSSISTSSKRSDSKMRTNSLMESTGQNWARITPWRTLSEEDFTISVTTLHDGPRKQVLGLLERYGIARLRWQGDPPTPERLLSIENWIGPARTEQNDFKGKVNSLRPDNSVAPNTGSSSKALSPHVDGTQDEFTPALLAFQYDFSSTWGGESTFLDMAALLGTLPADDLEQILTALARRDCATCTKTKGEWTKTFSGPLFRSVCDGRSVSVRLRLDDLMQVIPECETEFERLKQAVETWAERHMLSYTPQEGDLVIFDNWRLLHGRTAIGGRHQRIHDRMWIDNLLPVHEGKYLLGIRPIGTGLMDAIQRANAD